MALIEYDEYKQRLRDLGPELEKLSAALDMDSARAEARKLEDETAQDGFWNDLERSQKVQQRLKQLQNKIARQDKLVTEWQDLTALCEMGQEAEDEELLEELKSGFQTLEEKIEESRMATLLSGEYDGHSAILTFHAGAGGTEAQDWAEMLLRMYTRWAARHSFSVEEMDYLAGEEAGVKRVTLRIIGSYAFGLLRSERGIHRLIRISPFDSSGRRHTSFASVDVIPDVGSEIKLDIKESDLRIDTFHASGPGGQGVNTTTSAVRITHLPTGITAQCQNERSQHHNKDMAMRILKARLYNLEIEKRDAERQAAYDSKNAIAFGSQIRTYTLQPFQLIKDHRTGCESTDCAGVLDGDIDKFAHAYLLYRFEKLHRIGEK